MDPLRGTENEWGTCDLFREATVIRSARACPEWCAPARRFFYIPKLVSTFDEAEVIGPFVFSPQDVRNPSPGR